MDDLMRWHDAPEKIYLQVCPEADHCEVPFHEHDEVTWCHHRVNDSDVEYVRADQMREYAKKAVEAERANRPYWLCCGGIDPQVHRRGCIEAQSGHPERCVFGTASEHSAHR